MKSTLTYIAALALVTSQLIGCTATKTTSNIGANFNSNFSGTGNKNVCSLNNLTKTERKTIAYQNYCLAIKNSYGQNGQAVVADNSTSAGGAYMYITNFQAQNKKVAQ